MIDKKLTGMILAIGTVIAILAASPALPFVKKPLLSEQYGEVLVEYYPGGSGVELDVSTDVGAFGYVANAYIAVPYSDFRYLGAWGSRDGRVIIPTAGWLDDVIDSWLNATNSSSLERQRIALLLFLSFVTKDYMEYDKIVSVPLNLTLAETSRVKASMQVSLSGLKPSGMIDLSRATRCSGCGESAKGVVGEEYIRLGCLNGVCTCYTARWVAPASQYWSTGGYVWVPITWVLLHNDTKKTLSTYLAFIGGSQEGGTMATLIGKISMNSNRQDFVGLYHAWNLSNAEMLFDGDRFFYNDRWEDWPPHYHDDALLALTVKVSGAVGNFTKQEKYCECGLCDNVSYWDTAENAILIVEDIYASEQTDSMGKGRIRVPMRYSIDDEPFDGSGFLENYTEFLLKQVDPYRYRSEKVLIEYENFHFEETGWHYGKVMFGPGFSVTGLVSEYLGITVDVDPEYGLMPIFMRSASYYTSVTIDFSENYDFANVSAITYRNKGLYYYDNIQIGVPINFINVYIC